MKFVVESRQKDIFLMLPVEKRLEIVKGTDAFIKKYRNSGKCKDIYEHGDLRGAVSIWEVESDAEVAKLILENPIAPFSDLDIMPVIDYDIAMKAIAEALGKLA